MLCMEFYVIILNVINHTTLFPHRISSPHNLLEELKTTFADADPEHFKANLYSFYLYIQGNCCCNYVHVPIVVVPLII